MGYFIFWTKNHTGFNRIMGWSLELRIGETYENTWEFSSTPSMLLFSSTSLSSFLWWIRIPTVEMSGSNFLLERIKGVRTHGKNASCLPGHIESIFSYFLFYNLFVSENSNCFLLFDQEQLCLGIVNPLVVCSLISTTLRPNPQNWGTINTIGFLITFLLQ